MGKIILLLFLFIFLNQCNTVTGSVEGTTDPIGRFERFLTEYDENIKNLFYSENFLRLFPNARI